MSLFHYDINTKRARADPRAHYECTHLKKRARVRETHTSELALRHIFPAVEEGHGIFAALG